MINLSWKLNTYYVVNENVYFRRETQDIEEGADRILTQVLVPRNLCSFEDKISIAVNDYLGIKNDTPPVELNGLFNLILFKYCLNSIIVLRYELICYH